MAGRTRPVRWAFAGAHRDDGLAMPTLAVRSAAERWSARRRGRIVRTAIGAGRGEIDVRDRSGGAPAGSTTVGHRMTAGRGERGDVPVAAFHPVRPAYSAASVAISLGKKPSCAARSASSGTQ